MTQSFSNLWQVSPPASSSIMVQGLGTCQVLSVLSIPFRILHIVKRQRVTFRDLSPTPDAIPFQSSILVSIHIKKITHTKIINTKKDTRVKFTNQTDSQTNKNTLASSLRECSQIKARLREAIYVKRQKIDRDIITLTVSYQSCKSI